MAALSILQFDMTAKVAKLDAELNGCINVQGRMRNTVREFLLQEGIYSIGDINDKDKLNFKNYLGRRKDLSDGQKSYYISSLEMLQLHYYSVAHGEMLKEIEKDMQLTAALRKAETYLISHNVSSLRDIDYKVRSSYEAYLANYINENKIKEYLKILDIIKLNAIKRECEKGPFKSRKLNFSEEKIFLLYHADYDLAMSFYYTRDKKELVFDFSLPAPVKIKHQIFDMLNYTLENVMARHDRRERFIVPLKLLYQFCIEHGIEDMERLEEEQIEAFRKSLIEIGNTLDDSYMQIVDNIRKFLFLDAAKTNWEANVWYMERFHLQSDRMNPSNPVLSISFFQVHSKENRKYFQGYMQYLIGITNIAIQNIRCQHYRILEFLQYCDKKGILVTQITGQDVDEYLKTIEENIQPETFNGKVVNIYRFFRFLWVKVHIGKVPFVLEYYLKDTFPVHHNRSVQQATISQMLTNLYLFPEHLRLMYLHLWSIGLRVNEVCMLKVNAYYQRKGDTWIKLYQNKMKAEKTVPIPSILYELMRAYIERNQIMPGEYVFQNAKGGAFDVNTFSKQMVTKCRELGISCGDYTFRSHDYRHMVATSLYAHGASLQAVRDYLGHKDENMTKQYLDYIPEKIDKANEEYFKEKKSSLAGKIKMGGRHEQ